MSENIKIAVVGSGYVGLVAAVCFAEMGHDVICVDNDEHKVAALQGGDSLIHENFLPDLLQKYRNTKVRFTTDLAEATHASEAASDNAPSIPGTRVLREPLSAAQAALSAA